MPDRPESIKSSPAPEASKTNTTANPEGTNGQPAPSGPAEIAPADQPASGPTLRFKRYYTPHELERERIRRELAEPYRLTDPQ